MAIMAFLYKWVSFSIYVVAIHGILYPMNRRIFQRDGVSRTHYSNCERSELSSSVWPAECLAYSTGATPADDTG